MRTSAPTGHPHGVYAVDGKEVLFVDERRVRTARCADKLRGLSPDRVQVFRDESMPVELREYLVKSVLEPMKAGMAVSDMTEKKTVEQLKTEYAALAAEAREIDERIAQLQPALAEHERLEARLNQIRGTGRNLITSVRVALKEALFEREIGGTDKSLIAEPDPLALVGVSTVHLTTTGRTVLYGFGGGGGSSSSPPATTFGFGGGGGSSSSPPATTFDAVGGERLPRTRTEPSDGPRLTGQKLVIDERGKGYWR